MDVPLQGLRWAISLYLDDGRPIPPFWASGRRPSPNCPGTSRRLEVRCHPVWKEGPLILAVFWKMEVGVVERTWKVWNDGTMSDRDWHGGMRKL